MLSGRRSAAKVARRHKVSAPTVSRILAAHRAALAAAEAGGVDGGALGAVAGPGALAALPSPALGSRIAIVSTSGSGKTYAAKSLAERLMAGGAPVCLVDPLGVWWGLRHGAGGAGSAPPFPAMVFGGLHGHVPLQMGMGGALGWLVGTQPMGSVVDLSGLGSAGARRAFRAAFTEAPYEVNTELLHLVLVSPQGRRLLFPTTASLAAPGIAPAAAPTAVRHPGR